MPPRFQQRPRNTFPSFGNRQYNPNYMVPQRMYQQNFYYHPMRQGRGPFRFSNRFQQVNRGGGFLSRLLNKRQPQPVNPFQFGPITRQAETGVASWLNPDSISRFLGQTQQILRTGQQIGGMVQQYGPLVKNLPALWKIYRGLNSESTPSENESNETQEKNQTNDEEIFNDEFFSEVWDEHHVNEKDNRKKDEENKKKQQKNPRNLKEKKSIPKIYI